MPQMDGLHLCKRVKDDAQLRDTPVLLFSSLITEDTKHKGDGVGADAQLAKPDMGRLVEVLDELVTRAAA